VPGISFVPPAIEDFGYDPKLDNKVAGQILRVDLTAFFSPEAMECGFVLAHNDPGIRATNK
jgi:hypothetical protein